MHRMLIVAAVIAGIVARADAQPAPAPFDITKLVAWPVVPSTLAHQPAHETEVFAIDASIDSLLELLWPGDATHPLIIKSIGGTISGHVLAATRADAFQSVAAAAGVDVPRAMVANNGAYVELEFAQAPSYDLLRVLADVGHFNVVAPGALPDLDVVLKHASADSVLAAIAKVDDRVLTRAGNTYYLMPKATPLPAIAIKSTAAVELQAHHATAAEMSAAIRAVLPAFPMLCGGDSVTLHLTHTSASDAARAIVVMTGATVAGHADAGCAIADAATLDLTDARFVAAARVGTQTAGVLAHGDHDAVVRGSKTVDLTPQYISSGGASISMFKLFPDDPPPPPPTFVRTSAVVRSQHAWRALAVSADGKTHYFDDSHRDYSGPPGAPLPRISTAGVSLGDPDAPTVVPIAPAAPGATN